MPSTTEVQRVHLGTQVSAVLFPEAPSKVHAHGLQKPSLSMVRRQNEVMELQLFKLHRNIQTAGADS